MSTIKLIPGGTHAALSERPLSAFQWRFAMLVISAANAATPPGSDTSTLGRDAVIDAATPGAVVLGVIYEPAERANDRTTVQTHGRSKVKVSEAVNVGDFIKSGADGVGVKAQPGEPYAAAVLEPAPAGAIAAVMLGSGVTPQPAGGVGIPDGGGLPNPDDGTQAM